MPHIIVIAGPNGAGKTTSAPRLLKDSLDVLHFVNADTIAAGLSAYAPEKAAIQAGRTMLDRMHQLAKDSEDFAFETTLASRSFAPWIIKLKEKGYIVHITFLYIKHPDLSVDRVRERVKLGGHFVPEDTIRRRYTAGLKNFFKLYKPIADSWQMYDNTNIDVTRIASNMDDEFEVYQPELWQELTEAYDETT